jgi:uncharacterized SAM-binding protein YcdF (DUF218 family)
MRSSFNPTEINSSKPLEVTARPDWPPLSWLVWVVLIALTLLLCVPLWGGRLLVSSDALPQHVDAAVVLQGSLRGERARIAGAMMLLKSGIAGRMLLSIPAESFWGQPVPPMAQQYFEKNYGSELAGRIEFCETKLEVNSTEEEAGALLHCIREHKWSRVAVVTSNYHTRRAGMIWRKAAHKEDPSIELWIAGVPDPEYREKGWWRERLSAKTWLLEFTKLLWTSLAG